MTLQGKLKIYFLISSFAISLNGYGQLNAEQKKQTINSTLQILKAKYILTDILPELDKTIRQNYANGKYDTISTGNEFAFQLTRDLQGISKDQHLKILYSESKKGVEQSNNKQDLPKDQWMKNLMVENN